MTAALLTGLAGTRQTLQPVVSQHQLNLAVLAIWFGMAFLSLCSVIPPIVRAVRDARASRRRRLAAPHHPASAADPAPMPRSERTPGSAHTGARR